MTIWIILAVIAGLITLAAVSSRGKRRESDLDKLQGSWGRFQSKKYPKDDYEAIAHYAKSLQDTGFYVDDITWNDLEMDRIFQAMDNSRSSIGREYLYKTLRMPAMDPQEAEDTGRSVSWVSRAGQGRERLQLILSKLGFVRNFSFSDYIDSIQSLKSVGSGISILLDILLVAAILVTVLANAAAGVVMIIAVALIATAVYFKKKPGIEPYFICLSQVSRMVRTGSTLMEEKEIFRNAPDCLKEKVRDISICVDVLKPCTKGDWLIADSRSTGSPGEVFMNYIRMFTHVDIIHYNRAIKRMQGRKKEIMTLMDSFGFLEMIICAASFREAVPVWSDPVFTRDVRAKELELEGVIHPLIKDPVPNSVNVPYEDKTNALITGSNASGKSTFLKAVAINAILSQAIATACAQKYRAPVFRIYSSMSLRDDLKTSGSYYMVEIRSLKRILEAVDEESDVPVLCFIDEVLRGTNTIERIAASSSILESAGKKNAVIFAATHDIELTSLLEESFVNYHFREEMTSDGIEFSYRLQEGPAVTRNAIALLESLGYDTEVTDEAKKRAGYFTQTGIWK